MFKPWIVREILRLTTARSLDILHRDMEERPIRHIRGHLGQYTHLVSPYAVYFEFQDEGPAGAEYGLELKKSCP